MIIYSTYGRMVVPDDEEELTKRIDSVRDRLDVKYNHFLMEYLHCLEISQDMLRRNENV